MKNQSKNIEKLNKLLKLKRTVLLYFAIVLNTLLGYIAVKLNTNLLSVTEFGYYSFFIATLTLSQTFFNLGLFESTSRLLAIEKESSKIRRLYGTLILLTSVLSIIFILFLRIWALISDIIFEIKIGWLLSLLSPLVFVILFQNMLLLTLRGSGEIRKLSWFTFVPRFVYVLTLILLSLTHLFTLKATSLSFLLSILLVDLIFCIWVKPIFKDVRENIIILFSEVKAYGRHLFVANIGSVLIFTIDKFILAYYLDADHIAFYALAFTISAPLAYFSMALSQSKYKEFAHQKRIDPPLLKLNMIAILTFTSLLIIFREFIVLELFSAKFGPSIPVLVILALAFCFVGLASPYTMFFKAQKRGREVRNITLVVSSILLVLSLILVPIAGLIGAAIAVLIAYVIDYLLYLWLYYRFIIQTN
jgi:O-antigen/teichoic acid export membrane protein